MKKLFTLVAISASVLLVSCKKNTPAVSKPAGGVFVEELNQNLTACIVRDQFNPPVASRVYAYSFLAAYEATVPFYKGYPSCVGKINGLTEIPQPANIEELDSNVVALAAFARVGKELSFKNHVLVDYEKAKLDEYTQLIGKERTDKSVEYGRKVGEAILAWSKKDNYVNIKKSSKYTVRSDSRVHWIPTYPDYAEAAEPQWMTLRPMLMDSAGQFELPPPTPFDSLDKAGFYSENMEVYKVCGEVCRDSADERRTIAYFWDDNPNVTVHHGHMGFSELKLTPGGHWVAITSATCRQQNKNLMESLKAHLMVSAAVFDGFIACWHGKYQYEYIRPITYIRRYIDPNWDAFLQTPPFPEYPSGHSVVSGSASSVLTSLFGDNYAFTDSSEMPYLHGVRKFTSFNAAAEEAAMSRLYGGIHYMPAIKNGVVLGRSVGDNVVNELK